MKTLFSIIVLALSFNAHAQFDMIGAHEKKEARTDDKAKYYVLEKDTRSSYRMNGLFKYFIRANGQIANSCMIASDVKDFKVPTNPADRFGVIYITGNSLFGAYPARTFDAGMDCSANETEMIALGVQRINGAYKYNWITPTGGDEDADAESYLSILALVNTGSPMIMVRSGDGKKSYMGARNYEWNPCWTLAGKPYRKFAVLVHLNDGRVAWIDPRDPHSAYQNKTQEKFTDLNEFMSKNKISYDGQNCI